MDIDVAARQGEGVDVRRIDDGEMILQIAAVAAAGDPLAYPLHVGLELFIVVAGELLEDFLVVASAHAEFLLLAHHHEIALAGGRVHRAAAQRADSQQQ